MWRLPFLTLIECFKMRALNVKLYGWYRAYNINFLSKFEKQQNLMFCLRMTFLCSGPWRYLKDVELWKNNLVVTEQNILVAMAAKIFWFKRSKLGCWQNMKRYKFPVNESVKVNEVIIEQNKPAVNNCIVFTESAM